MYREVHELAAALHELRQRPLSNAVALREAQGGQLPAVLRQRRHRRICQLCGGGQVQVTQPNPCTCKGYDEIVRGVVNR